MYCPNVSVGHADSWDRAWVEGSVHNLVEPLNSLTMLSPKLNASASVSTAVKTAGQRRKHTYNAWRVLVWLAPDHD